MDAQKITFIENEANDTIKMIYIHLENYQKLYDIISNKKFISIL